MIFGITGNISKERISLILDKLINFFISKNIKFIIDKKFKSILSKDNIDKFFVSQSKLIQNANLIISLGGDGTFLNTARLVGNKDIPILGVNLGNLGFLSDVSENEITKFISEIAKNRFRTLEQIIITADFNGRNLSALNDIVIDKANSIRMIEITTFYNNEKVVKCLADGIIISTPTGSTGYSLSAGGPIVNPNSEVFIITPICPHTLNVRPIIIPNSGEIKIKVNKEDKVRITADGQKFEIANSPAEFFIRKADYKIRVIKKLNTSYFDTLRKKLFWGEDKRKF